MPRFLPEEPCFSASTLESQREISRDSIPTCTPSSSKDYTAWGVVNAVTALAHDTVDMNGQYDLEKVGGDIIRLSPPTGQSPPGKGGRVQDLRRTDANRSRAPHVPIRAKTSSRGIDPSSGLP